MNIKTKIVSSVVAATLPMMSGFAFANDGSPKVFGLLNAGVTKVQNETDVDGKAFEAALGVKGKYSQDDFTLIYKLEAEFTDAVNTGNGQSDLEIKNAMIVMPSQYGVFVVAPRIESGQQRELYGKVDIFEVNEANSSSGLWSQPDEASAVFAYVTPKFNNTHVVGAVLTLKNSGTVNNNDNDVDAWVLRAVHKGENLYLGAGVVAVAEEMLPTDDTYYRYALTAGYAFDKVDLGMTWEHNSDHPAGDIDVLGVTADFELGNGWSAGIGYTDKNADLDALDNSAALAIVRKQILKNVFAYGEVANFDNSNDNYSVGIKVTF